MTSAAIDTTHVGIRDRPLRVNPRIFFGRDEINVAVKRKLPLLAKPARNLHESVHMFRDRSSEAVSILHQHRRHIVPMRRLNANLAEHPFETQFDYLLRLAHNIRIRLVVEKHLEDAQALRGLDEVALREGCVCHSSKTSPGR